MNGAENGQMSFWAHLDVLRGALIRIAIATAVLAVVAFCFKDILFDIVLAPKESGFITYRIFNRVSAMMGQPPATFSVELINTGLAQQFIIHMKTALCMALLLVAPYILYEAFRFVQPALYDRELRYASRLVGSGYLMFMTGVGVSYFLIFPLTFRFLGTYQVEGSVANMITLESYMSTLITMSMMLGVMFELPVILWIGAKMGVVSAGWLRKFRKHAIVAILIAAAVVTPTSDIFTLLITSLPVYLLYEMSIVIVSGRGAREWGAERGARGA